MNYPTTDAPVDHDAALHTPQPAFSAGLLWALVWTIGLAALIWVAHHRLVPAVERQTASSVRSALGAIDGNAIEVTVHGYTTRLAGTIDDDAQRPVLIEAAYQVEGVREVIDALDVAKAVPDVPAVSRRTAPSAQSFDPLAALSLAPATQTTLTPNRRADGMPRIKVFGSILPPWRAPAVFAQQEQSTDPVNGTDPMTELPANTDPSDDTGRVIEPIAELPTTSTPPARTGRKPALKTLAKPADQPPATDEELLSRFEALKSAQIAFRVDSHQLTTPSRRMLDELAALLAQFYSAKLDIGGHTDALGDEGNNLLLSQQRSNSVRDYLVAQGVSPYRLIAHGYGESLPIASNGTAVGRATNRRIELQLR